jgi:hypothetical protein
MSEEEQEEKDERKLPLNKRRKNVYAKSSPVAVPT